MNPFDYLNAINATKEDVMVDDVAESKYNAFLINRGLSYFVDTVLYANEMNLHNLAFVRENVFQNGQRQRR